MQLRAASFRIISHDSAGRYGSDDMFYMGVGQPACLGAATGAAERGLVQTSSPALF